MDGHMFWGGDRYYEIREDGRGDVEFDTIGRPTYDGEAIVAMGTDAVLRLAEEIIRLRGWYERKQHD